MSDDELRELDWVCYRILKRPGGTCRRYSTDHAAARLLEDEIERRDQETRGRYVWALAEEIRHPWHEPWSSVEMFMLIRATPEQRARAFLAAVQDD